MSSEPEILNWDILHPDFQQIVEIEWRLQLKNGLTPPIQAEDVLDPKAYQRDPAANKFAKALLRRYRAFSIKILKLRSTFDGNVVAFAIFVLQGWYTHWSYQALSEPGTGHISTEVPLSAAGVPITSHLPPPHDNKIARIQPGYPTSSSQAGTSNPTGDLNRQGPQTSPLAPPPGLSYSTAHVAPFVFGFSPPPAKRPCPMPATTGLEMQHIPVNYTTSAITWARDPRLTRDDLLRALRIDVEPMDQRKVDEEDLANLGWPMVNVQPVINRILGQEKVEPVDEVWYLSQVTVRPGSPEYVRTFPVGKLLRHGVNQARYWGAVVYCLATPDIERHLTLRGFITTEAVTLHAPDGLNPASTKVLVYFPGLIPRRTNGLVPHRHIHFKHKDAAKEKWYSEGSMEQRLDSTDSSFVAEPSRPLWWRRPLNE